MTARRTRRSAAEALVLAAPAKINLWLRVLARREDGYHEIDTLFQLIDLADRVRVERAGRRLDLVVEGADLGPLEDNLAFRAAARARAALGLRGGLRIRLEKRIPVGAGLGGGSSDAAAVLRCVARLAGVDERDERLARIAAELGADVPFFLCGSTLARGRGRGDELEPLAPLPPADLVVVSPPLVVSTAWAYRALGAERGSGAGLAPEPPEPPSSWEELGRVASNDFESLVARAHADVGEVLRALAAAGARAALMSGSGSSAFGLFGDRAAAELAAERLSLRSGWRCEVVRTLERVPEPVTS